MLFSYLREHPGRTCILIIALTAVIAILDWQIKLNGSFGFLYMFPMLLAGPLLRPRLIPVAALSCTILADVFDALPFTSAVELPRDFAIFVSLSGSALFSRELTESYRRERSMLQRAEAEAAARREAEQQLQFVLDSSPAAVLTADSSGRILLANPAAHRIFAMEDGKLRGEQISQFVPSLRAALPAGHGPAFRAEMQNHARRANGEVFLAQVFFATYQTPAGQRLAAVVADASDQLREREETTLEQLLTGSRILVAAVSHEVRNVCGAIGVVRENLVRQSPPQLSAELDALGALVDTLHRIASVELKDGARSLQGRADLSAVLADWRIVLDAQCRDEDIELEWRIPDELPPIETDRHRLLQVLLNLTRNSQRALADAPEKRISISARQRGDEVALSIQDSGPGIADASHLFEPLQKGAQATGLGLYLSRALVRSLGGDLRHDPSCPGCCFVLHLPITTPTTAA